MRQRFSNSFLAALLACALTLTGVCPASAAQAGGSASGGTDSVSAGAPQTKTNPTYNQELARRVLVAAGVVSSAQAGEGLVKMRNWKRKWLRRGE